MKSPSPRRSGSDLRAHTLVVGAVTMLTLAACTGTPEVAQDPSPEPVRTVDQPAAATSPAPPDPAEAVEQYMRALASNDLAVMREALQATADGSAANAYLRFHIAQNEALLELATPCATHPETCPGRGTGTNSVTTNDAPGSTTSPPTASCSPTFTLTASHPDRGWCSATAARWTPTGSARR